MSKDLAKQRSSPLSSSRPSFTTAARRPIEWRDRPFELTQFDLDARPWWPVLARTHFNCIITSPSDTVGAATPVLPAFLAIQARATRMLSCPDLS
jgi:hypothetical protein